VRLASRFARHLDAGVAFIHKRRLAEVHNEAAALQVVGDVAGLHAVVIDDMIDTGGTVVAAADMLSRAGALSVRALATHGVLSPPAAERFRTSALQEVVITNTLPVPEDAGELPSLRVLSVGPSSPTPCGPSSPTSRSPPSSWARTPDPVSPLMDSIEIAIRTGSAPSVVDVTAPAAGFVAGRGDGLLSVYLPHATAGLAIMETGAGSDQDLLAHLGTLFPGDDRWRHRHGSPGHGAQHVVPAFVSPSLTVPVLGGHLALGTWQSIVVVDPNGDNPTRRLRLSFLAG